MMTTAMSIGVITLWITCNVAVASTMSSKEIREDFIEGQNFVGKALANIFYFPAWIIKRISK